MFHAVITNPNHCDYGIATITFPLPSDDYEGIMVMLEALKVGDTRKADIYIDEVYNCPPILKRLEGTLVNLDELDYLAKRLESFIEYETAQFQAMAHKLDIRSVPDFINLSYCCQLATVVTDVTDLEGIGRTHLINLNGGSIATSELEKADLSAVAAELLNSGSGIATPYGMVYDNGMELAPVYDGHHLPRYNYRADLLTVALTSKADGSDTPNTTWIYLPCDEICIERAIKRSGIAFEQMQFSVTDSMLPDDVEAAITFENEGIRDLNSLARCVQQLSRDEQKKLTAVVSVVKPERAMQICRIAEHLEELYDYAGLGRRHIEQEQGVFTDHGYVACPGTPMHAPSPMLLNRNIIENLAQR